MRRLLAVAAAVVMAPGMAGCAGSLFETKVAPPTTYRLAALPVSPGAAPAPASSLDLAVLRPRVLAGLESERIAVLYPDRHLDYYAGSRWGGPLEQVVQDLAIEVLRGRALFRSVDTDTSAFASTAWLELDVTDFQAEYADAARAPRVHVHFVARLGNALDRKMLGRFEADAVTPAADNRMSAIVAAYEQAADQALAAIAVDVAGLLRP